MIRVISLFCGIGGADLGIYAAARDLGIDVEVVAAYDSWAKACEVYNANLPHPVAQVADVKMMTRAELPPHDLIIGGPPCQPFSLAGKRRGADDPRNCLQDFVRLAAGSAWVMENVIPRLLQAPFSVKLNASDYGDVTTRKRWFYSDHLLQVIPTPGVRRIRDIREHSADRPERDRSASLARKRAAAEAKSHSGINSGSTLIAMGLGEDDRLGTITAHSWHGFNGDGRGTLLRYPGGVRCHTLLEAQRAHSLPDDWEWLGTKGDPDRGKMIANMWPIGMATAVTRAMLVAMGVVERAA